MMQTYKEKLMHDISLLSNDQAKIFYSLFQVLKRELVLKSEKKDDWKEDFRKISVWEEDNFDQIREEFSNWKIEKF